jgi:putative DNA primase/helicase
MSDSPVVDFGAILAQFRQAAEARGLLLPDHIEADGRLHRCPLISGPVHKLTGAYVLHLDGVACGGFENHADGIGWEKWTSRAADRLSPVDAAALRQKMELIQAERNAALLGRQRRAAAKATEIWARNPYAKSNHPYLESKSIDTHGVKAGAFPVYDHTKKVSIDVPDTLLIPLYPSFGPSAPILGIQGIFAAPRDGIGKMFLPGARKSGCFYVLGEVSPGQPIAIAEGFATAASCRQATGWATVVAFDAGNLPHVAQACRAYSPESVIVIAADDDSFGHCVACKAPVRVEDGDTCPACGQPHKRRNAGQIRAREAAKEVGGVVASPLWPDPAARWEGFQQTGKAPTDFNDLHQISGLDAVRQILSTARTALKDAAELAALSAEAVLPTDPEPEAATDSHPMISSDEATPSPRSAPAGQGQGRWRADSQHGRGRVRAARRP